MIQIDDDVPLPGPLARKRKYPFAEMRVGQSFFVPGIKNAGVIGITPTAKKTGYKFTSRRVTEEGQCGIRVWRIA